MMAFGGFGSGGPRPGVAPPLPAFCQPDAFSPPRVNSGGEALEKRDLVLSQSTIDRVGNSYPCPLRRHTHLYPKALSSLREQ